MSDNYRLHCECGTVNFELSGQPRVRGHCHCEDCRDLHNLPYYSVTAWNSEQLEIKNGHDAVAEYQHPRLEMKRYYCKQCGETLFNSNAMDWRVVSQLLIRKCHGGVLPDELSPESHFYYGRRIVDIDDDLPRHD